MNRITRLLDTSISSLGPNRVEAIAGTSGLARDGHIVDMRGLEIQQFLRTGCILWGHDPDIPVGNPVSGYVDNTGNLRLTIDFAAEGTSERADEVRRLVKAGIVKSMSISFEILDANPLNPNQPRGGQRVTRSELLEASFVTVPADPRAVVTARAGRGGRGGPDSDYEQRQRDVADIVHHGQRQRDIVRFDAKARKREIASYPPTSDYERRQRELLALKRLPH